MLTLCCWKPRLQQIFISETRTLTGKPRLWIRKRTRSESRLLLCTNIIYPKIWFHQMIKAWIIGPCSYLSYFSYSVMTGIDHEIRNLFQTTYNFNFGSRSYNHLKFLICHELVDWFLGWLPNTSHSNKKKNHSHLDSGLKRCCGSGNVYSGSDFPDHSGSGKLLYRDLFTLILL
jgi:hypothetical protein